MSWQTNCLEAHVPNDAAQRDVKSPKMLDRETKWRKTGEPRKETEAIKNQAFDFQK
jgi:hypothetical protein